MRLWPGADTNRVEALSADRDFEQVLLYVQEPSRAFQRKIPKRHSRPPKEPGLERILFETAYNWICEFRTPSAERRFLCGRDETHLFIAQVPEGNSVAEAHEALKPDEVRAAERLGRLVLRQGEWFFIPARLVKVMDFMENVALETRTLRPHMAQELAFVGRDIYVRGTIDHIDHRPLVLEDWHRVVRNREIVDAARRGGNLWID